MERARKSERERERGREGESERARERELTSTAWLSMPDTRIESSPGENPT